MRKTFQTNKAPGGVAPLSALTVGGGLVFLSGLTAMDPVTGTIEGDAAAQADKALLIVEDVLKDYGLTMDDMKEFRQMGALTPGHPEYGHTVGVEATTGPLGAGMGMAVGMASLRKAR